MIPTASPLERPRNSTERLVAGLRRLRGRTLVHTLRGKLAGSRVRLALTLLFGLVMWLGLLGLFGQGFLFLQRHRLISGPLIEMIFGLFFSSIFLMIVFSSGLLTHAGLFASREAEYLLCQPIPPGHVFAYKFQESVFFACWGFLLAGSPLLVAYGWTAGVPWSFYAAGAILMVAFSILASGLGSIFCLFLVLAVPRRRRESLIALLVVLVGLLGWLGWRVLVTARDRSLASRRWIENLLEAFPLAELPFLPSAWMTRGLLAAAVPRGESDALFYLLVLTANACFVFLLATMAFEWTYRPALDRVRSHPAGRVRGLRTRSFSLVDVLARCVAPRSRPIRVLLAKDFRSFFRDPLQWLQVFIFSGLLVLYFVALARSNFYMDNIYWKTMIGFFNLAVTGLFLSTFTSRFVFPLLSLEGQAFWVLGLCPIDRRTILWSKFAFSASGSLAITVTLTALSAWMLRLDWSLVGLHLLTVALLCFGLSGIAVGLGARFPERRERDPSKIAAGFGGTLNLVASLVFILLVVLLLALPCHLYSITEAMRDQYSRMEIEAAAAEAPTLLGRPLDASIQQARLEGISLTTFRWWLGFGVSASIALGALATFLPMHLGGRAFDRMEF